MITIEYTRHDQTFTAYYGSAMLAFNADLRRLLIDMIQEADDLENQIKGDNYVGEEEEISFGS